MYSLSGLHSKGPLTENLQKCSQFTTLRLSCFTVKTHIEADSYLITKDNKIIKVINIIDNNKNSNLVILCKKFENGLPLFRNPIESIKLDMYVVSNLSTELNVYYMKDIKKKFAFYHQITI